MNYGIHFDESNKLDQPNGAWSYYGALGVNVSKEEQIKSKINALNEELRTQSELHFVDYTSDTHFEKYFRTLNHVLNQDVKINMMIVNKEDARKIAEKMNVTLAELRELFYVKIPERLFYGMTRDLTNGEHVQIIIDENSEYDKIDLAKKLEEQMNAHSAYRNKGYKVSKPRQESSDEYILLQLIDVFMGIVIFLLESQYKQDASNGKNITLEVKSDLIYRLLIHQNNLEKFHEKITLFKWEGVNEQVEQVSISEYTGEFIIHKTRYDISEMKKLYKLRVDYPSEETKFYREKMGYSTRQLRTIQGYIAELKGEGRNDYYLAKEK